MKVVVFGAGGIVGQHMVVSKPSAFDSPVFTRTSEDGIYTKFVWGEDDLDEFLDTHNPDVVVNLAGENRVDVVQNDPDRYYSLNCLMPEAIAKWCNEMDIRFIQASTQAVFDGKNPPYGPSSETNPVNAYGEQNVEAENLVLELGGKIVRLTFVYGIRPFSDIGRMNPLEDMIAKEEEVQVQDHFFSPLLADDAASILWDLVENDFEDSIIHLGEPISVSRHNMSCRLCWATYQVKKVHGVSYKYFQGIAERPADTTWASGSLFKTSLDEGLLNCYIKNQERRL